MSTNDVYHLRRDNRTACSLDYTGWGPEEHKSHTLTDNIDRVTCPYCRAAYWANPPPVAQPEVPDDEVFYRPPPRPLPFHLVPRVLTHAPQYQGESTQTPGSSLCGLSSEDTPRQVKFGSPRKHRLVRKQERPTCQACLLIEQGIGRALVIPSPEDHTKEQTP